MTLVNRVSAYFLAALAIVLAGCSALFYAILSRQLHRQFSQENSGALSALVAAVEVEPDAAKWQPTEHAIAIGAGANPETIRWVVFGDGKIVETSRSASGPFLDQAKEIADRATDQAREVEQPAAPDWAFLSQRLAAAAPVHADRELDEFDEVVVVVGRPTHQLSANLRQLAGLATLLPVGGWLAAAAVGRWFCRRALQPVLSMAAEARSMSGADFQRRLPVSPSSDELTDLGVAFNTLLDRLQRSFDAQRRFTGDAAHELRTPLTVLLGQIDVALRKPRSDEEYRGTLRVLRNEADDLQQTLESLLFLARADEDAAPPDMTHVALDQWLRAYLERYRKLPRGGDLHLEVDGPVEANVSPPLLTRLLDNLVDNALKYSEPGSPVTVRVSAAKGMNSDAVHLTVADHGPGIASEDLPSIFEPFFRSHAARTSGASGAGLGLAIAHRIAVALRGELHCESMRGQGAAFTLKLPVLNCSGES